MQVLDRTVQPQAIQLMMEVKTLNDVQKLAGIINWIWLYLGLSSSQLKPLLELLKGDTDIAALWSLTPETKQTVEVVERAIQEKHVWRIEMTVAVQVFVLIDDMIPFAMIVQCNSGWEGPLHVLEWAFLPCRNKNLLLA